MWNGDLAVADALEDRDGTVAPSSLPDDWIFRLVQAALLRESGRECAMCGGTGGWPGYRQFVSCRPCQGTGTAAAWNENGGAN